MGGFVAKTIEKKLAADVEKDMGQDPELRAMATVVAALKNLDADAQNRVLDYVERRLGLQRQQSARPSRTYDDSSNRFRDEPPSEKHEQEKSLSHEEENRRTGQDSEELEGISPIAQRWMQRNDLTASQLSSLYSLGVDEIDLVASKVPGKSAREKLHNVILLVGVGAYLSSGAARIENEKLKAAMRDYHADVGRNFAAYMRDWASEVSGSRAAGDLTLTSRGLNAAKELIKQMTVSKQSEG